ncbi:MAG: hypothetical protein HYW27_03980 [Candidatus Aenigmarchaeota archaeon]|nr:hypothetical protein [Candidatus Aenigmarchaeota archaeon]
MNSILVTKKDFINSYENKKLGEFAIKKKNISFPLKPSKELAGIVGDLISDGHIGSHMVIYSSNNIENLNDFGRRIRKIFNVKYKIRSVITNTYGVKSLYVFDATVLRILKLCGVPEGNKVLQEYQIPLWITNKDEFMIEFLRRMFSNDGCVTHNENRIKIKIMFHKSEKILEDNYKFLDSIRLFLSKYDIKSTNIYKCGIYHRKDGIKTVGLGFEIQGTKNNINSALNFYHKIGFSDKTKSNKLENFIKKFAP